jgi:FdhE protein
MAEWLVFIARLTRAQQVVATTLRPFPGPQRITVESAVDARLPPLAAEGHRRDAAWREGLTMLLDTFDGRASPLPARAAMANLRARDADAVEALADQFLIRGVGDANAGAALYVAAALQVYFTRAVAGLPAASLRLLPQRGLCPCCGSTPVSGVVTASGRNSGARYLYCSLCATAWNPVPHLREDAVSGARHAGGPVRGRSGDPRPGFAGCRGRLGPPCAKPAAAHWVCGIGRASAGGRRRWPRRPVADCSRGRSAVAGALRLSVQFDRPR